MEDVGESLEQFLTTMTTTTVADTTLATTTSTKTENRSHLQLVELKLHGCVLGEEGTRPILEQLGAAGTRNSAMASTLSSLSALRTLNLSLNSLDFSSLSLPLANLKRYNETLECLDLSSPNCLPLLPKKKIHSNNN